MRIAVVGCVAAIGLVVCQAWAAEVRAASPCLAPGEVRFGGATLPLKAVRDAATGAITNLSVVGDANAMNWVHAADGRQYAWIGPKYAWGTGSVKIDGALREWTRPGRIAEGLELKVESRLEADGTLYERREFVNVSTQDLSLSEIDIHTPFNDNYPKSGREKFLRRCHAHVWAGGNAAWVAAFRMGGEAPHLGLAVVEGSVSAYGQKERSLHKGLSNVRGVLTLSPPDVRLRPGQRTAVAWRVFVHTGWDDFFRKLVAFGGVDTRADRYVLRVGEKARLTVRTHAGETVREWTCPSAGAHRASVPCFGNDGRSAVVELLGVDDPQALLEARARYILAKQQVSAPGTPYDGALVPYDPETGRQERRWETPDLLPLDHSEGGERMGMGVFLAKMAQEGNRDAFLPALLRYYRFARESLQAPDYSSWQTVDHASRKRAFNYPWFVWFYLEMYTLTGEAKYLDDAFGTMKRLFRGDVRLPHALVAFPLERTLKELHKAGRVDEERQLVGWARQLVGAVSTQGGLTVDGMEVGIAPEFVSSTILSLIALGEHLGERRYLDAARLWMTRAEAICGRQPSWQAHDIGLHHWDGYWFGKRKCWGDTLPHDWNGEMAQAFRRYAQAFGDKSYELRARKIADAMLGLFTPDGRGSCAAIFTDRVNGEPAKFFDPLCNDQDWALVFYLDLRKGR